MNYFGARYYDAGIGLWISPDAIRYNHSLYTYANNNPINYMDPDGNAPDPVSAIVGAGLGFRNMYVAQKRSVERGDSYWTTIGIGLAAYFGTLASSLATVPALGAVGGGMVVGGTASMTIDAVNQKLDNPNASLEGNKIAEEGVKGTLAGAVGGGTGAVISKVAGSGIATITSGAAAQGVTELLRDEKFTTPEDDN